MYLTAHHVASPAKQREGINVFLYFHEGQAWELLSPPDVADRNPGVLVAQSISVAPPGNRVRSYLDIIAPDDVRWEEVHVGLSEFVGRCQSGPLPWAGESGAVYFRVGMESVVANRWQKEVATLYRSAQALWMAHAT
jgi:hypothetical protein